MSNKSDTLYNKYRPKTLKTVFGNTTLKKELQQFVDGKRELPHSILFTGPSGAGKTTLARILAKTLGCDDMDITELDVGNFRGIDAMRDIIDETRSYSLSGNPRVWILDEFFHATKEAQTALLKTLEEPPKDVYFILSTTNPEQLIKTIRTRCTEYQVELLDEDEMMDLLDYVSEKEGKEFSEDALLNVVKYSDGSPRQALSNLERLFVRGEKEMEEALVNSKQQEAEIKELCQALLSKKSWKVICGILSKLKEQPETIRHAVLGYCNSVLLRSDNAQAALIIDCFKDPFYNSGKAGLTLACYNTTL